MVEWIAFNSPLDSSLQPQIAPNEFELRFPKQGNYFLFIYLFIYLFVYLFIYLFHFI